MLRKPLNCVNLRRIVIMSDNTKGKSHIGNPRHTEHLPTGDGRIGFQNYFPPLPHQQVYQNELPYPMAVHQNDMVVPLDANGKPVLTYSSISPYPIVQLQQPQVISQPQTPISNASIESRHVPSGDYKKKPKVKQNVSRRRALTACITCRTKKVRCDNVRPRCGACIKNDIAVCEYVNEDQIKDITNYDSISYDILLKLDTIMDDVKSLKDKEVHVEPLQPVNINSDDKWDISFVSILKWKYFRQQVPDFDKDYDELERRLLRLYGSPNVPPNIDILSVEDKFSGLKVIEDVFFPSLSQCINSYFINCHTKAPILDTLNFVEAIELYRSFHKLIPNFSLLQLCEDFERTTLFNKSIGDLYWRAIEHGLEDKPFRRAAYFTLCRHIAIIPLVCGLGILSSPVQLDNFGKYKTSLEERSDLSSSCLTPESIKHIPSVIPRERLAIAKWMVTFSQVVLVFYPDLFKEGSIECIVYHILSNQFHLYVLDPVLGFKSINIACHNVMFYLDKRRNQQDEVIYNGDNEQRVIERLFWVCLKLECELRTELSPRCSKSGITHVKSPGVFPTIPDSIIDDLQFHSKECIQIASAFDDKYTWYYFLTEIAVRKVDNEFFNDHFTNNSVVTQSWEQPKFYTESFWISFIKYINQYNGIINSLSPSIRKFILQEVDVNQIFTSVQRASERRRAKESPNNISSDLSDFLINNELLVQSQSESIMYIKTRIISSKLLLFRPIIYLILHDKIAFTDLIEGIVSLLKNPEPRNVPETATSAFSDLSSTNDEIVMEYDKLPEVPLYYQKTNIQEDFSHYFSNNKFDENYFKIELLPDAKKQIIRLFFISLQSIPKLNIPKLAAHRHPGQWYYLRNVLAGTLYMFLLYKKLQELLAKVQKVPELQQLLAHNPAIQSIGALGDALEGILSRTLLINHLQHCLLVYNYWKDEATDCLVYQEIINRCLATLT